MLAYSPVKIALGATSLVLMLVLGGCSTTGDTWGGRASAAPDVPGIAVTPDTETATPPASFRDQLGWSDRINANDGTLYRVYELDVESGEILQVSVSSERFSPVLSLYAPDGTLLQMTIDSYNQYASPAVLTYRILRSGTHRLVVSAAEAGNAGPFEVTSSVLEENGEFSFPGEITGILAPGLGEVHPQTGADMQVYPIALAEDTRAEFTLSSANFDTYLSVVDATTGEEIAYNDDWGGSTDSRIVQQLTAGDYELWVTSFSPGSAGSFTLTGEVAAPPEPASELDLGGEHMGQLGTNRQPIPGGFSSGVPFILDIQEGAVLDVTMTSEVVDSYLYITDAEDNIIAEDDDSGGGVDSRLVIDLEPGQYQLWASSYSVDETGAYQLRTELIPSAEFDGTFLGDYLYHEQEVW